MRQASPLQPKLAKIDTANERGQRRRALRMNSAVMRKAREVFPLKTAHHLAEITGYSVRTVEYWLSESVVIPSDALVTLIRSHWGREFLAGLMVQAQPRWWVKVCSYFAALDAMSMQRIARRRLKEAVDADHELSASIARADALLVHDEDFHRPHADAVRAIACPRDSAVAAPAGRRR